MHTQSREQQKKKLVLSFLSFFLFFFFVCLFACFGGTGIWTQCLTLARKALHKFCPFVSPLGLYLQQRRNLFCLPRRKLIKIDLRKINSTLEGKTLWSYLYMFCSRSTDLYWPWVVRFSSVRPIDFKHGHALFWPKFKMLSKCFKIFKSKSN
jgi:hypothetical protein